MTPVQPPTIATRLLQSAGVDPALIGDLIEEYGCGARSRTWYWRQVMSILMRQILSFPYAAVRWVCALPFALVAAGLMPYVVLVAQSRLVPGASVSAAVMMLITAFLMATMFVSVGVWVAPDRKRETARIAFAVVVFWSVAFIASGLYFWEPTRIFTGVVFFTGGGIALVLSRLKSRSAAIV